MNSSGFGNSNPASYGESNVNMSFNSTSAGRGTGHHHNNNKGVSKPRLVKVRRQLSVQNPKTESGWPPGPGANPSRPPPPPPPEVSSSGFVFGACRSNSLGRMNLEKGILDEMKSLNIGSGGNVESSLLPDELNRKLNIGGEVRAPGKFAFNVDSANGLHDQMSSLNIKDSSGVRVTNHIRKDDFGNGRKEKSVLQEESENKLLDDMRNKLNIGSAMGQQPAGLKDSSKVSSSRIFGQDVDTGNKNPFRGDRSHVPLSQPKVNAQQAGVAASSSESFSFGGVPLSEGANPKDGGVPFVEFKTPNPKVGAFTGVNHKVEFSAKPKDSKLKKRRSKLKHSTAVHLCTGQDYNSKGEASEVSDSYSPMDISPYMLSDTRRSRESSVASEESFSTSNQFASTESDQQGISRNYSMEDLVGATERMDINTASTGEASDHCSGKDHDADGDSQDDSVSGFEAESFKSANEEIDSINGVVYSREQEASSSKHSGRQDSETRTQFYSANCSEDSGASGFTFAASSTAQSSLKPHPKKKNLSLNTKIPFASSSFKLTSASGASSLLSPLMSPANDSRSCLPSPSLLLSPSMNSRSGLPSPMLYSPSMNNIGGLPSTSPTVGDNSEMLRGKEIKQDSNIPSAASVAAQEACEKWRLRGNQAYKTGELLRAEDCYTQGLNCIPKTEKARCCLRALMLCYSNRAATRMSMGRMRDALEDCKTSSGIDPNFLRVQLRAASCYLALGEVENASDFFKKCLQLGSDVCVDRKIEIEASEGLQKMEKVTECIQRSAELLESGTLNDAGTAVEVISEALLISPFADKLVEMKAKGLFALRRYEDVIQLCEQTFDSAKKNSPAVPADYDPMHADPSALKWETSFRLWRCRLSFMSYFYLGKLEDAINSLEKHAEPNSASGRSQSKCDSSYLEKLIPLASTTRELLHHKVAGNEAFQRGKHSEAIEHYTAVLSRNVESLPFAAICFCNRAAAYKELGQITDAIADCSLAIALDGNYLKAISRRATLYEMIRDYGQAGHDLERLVSALARQAEDKNNQLGQAEGSTNLLNDLRQARLHLANMEEQDRKDIPLNAYLILGVETSASAAEIKKAYRKAALRHHPDKAGQSLARGENGDDGLWKEIGEEVHKHADRLFKMIGEAYAVLSDPAQRSQYDLEEMRNVQKTRSGNSTYRAYTDTHSSQFERGGGSRRHWREAWRAYGR